MTPADAPQLQLTAHAAHRVPRILAFATLFPNPSQPRLGMFVRNRLAALAAYCPTVVVAPVLSRYPLQRLEHGSVAAVPSIELQGGLEVHHPRFTTLPGIGRCADGAVLFWQTVSYVARLRADFPFDLIDAHYAFPDGAAAVMLAKRFQVPVCVTVRGGDLDVLTRYRLRRRIIRNTLANATKVFAVSRYLAARAEALGARPERIRVLPNGVDLNAFSVVPQREARRALGLDTDDRLILCVGNLIPEKGQQVLIEALGLMRAMGSVLPRLLIIGSDPRGGRRYLHQLERLQQRLGINDQITFVGPKPQPELASWYAAADMLVLPSFREGCPNVVREALACGRPVIASRVGGVPELVTSDRLGMLVQPGDPRQLAQAIASGLRRRWDHAAIAAETRGRTWDAVASILLDEFAALHQSSAASSSGATRP